MWGKNIGGRNTRKKRGSEGVRELLSFQKRKNEEVTVLSAHLH
jgi:hypothetical protein